jgi:hypothetical protein
MRIKSSILFLMSFCLNSILFAQDYNNYKPLKSVGNLPEDFTVSSTDKYRQEAAKVKASKDRRKDKNIKTDFYLKTTFAIDGLVRSGLVKPQKTAGKTKTSKLIFISKPPLLLMDWCVQVWY